MSIFVCLSVCLSVCPFVLSVHCHVFTFLIYVLSSHTLYAHTHTHTHTDSRRNLFHRVFEMDQAYIPPHPSRKHTSPSPSLPLSQQSWKEQFSIMVCTHTQSHPPSLPPSTTHTHVHTQTAIINITAIRIILCLEDQYSPTAILFA